MQKLAAEQAAAQAQAQTETLMEVPEAGSQDNPHAPLAHPCVSGESQASEGASSRIPLRTPAKHCSDDEDEAGSTASDKEFEMILQALDSDSDGE